MESIFAMLNLIDDQKESLKSKGYKDLLEQLKILKEEFEQKDEIECVECEGTPKDDEQGNFLRFKCGHYICMSCFFETLLYDEIHTCEECAEPFLIPEILGSFLLIHKITKNFKEYYPARER